MTVGTLINNVYRGITYRGDEGQWAWMLHRVTGLGVLLFLFLHILDIFLLGFGENTFDNFLLLYKAPPFRLLETALIFGVLFHAFNGVRVIIQDFWPATTRYQRTMFRVVLLVTALVFIPGAIAMLRPIFAG